MDDQHSWLEICKLAGYLCSLLVALATAISWFRRCQAHRGILLSGALIMIVVGSFWSLSVLFPSIFTRLFSFVWEQVSWLNAVGTLLFSIALLLIAMRRRNQERRIAELEGILRERDSAGAP